MEKCTETCMRIGNEPLDSLDKCSIALSELFLRTIKLHFLCEVLNGIWTLKLVHGRALKGFTWPLNKAQWFQWKFDKIDQILTIILKSFLHLFNSIPLSTWTWAHAMAAIFTILLKSFLYLFNSVPLFTWKWAPAVAAV